MVYYNCNVDDVLNSTGTSFDIVTDNTLDKDGVAHNTKILVKENNNVRSLTFNISGTTNPYVSVVIPYAKDKRTKLNFKEVVTADLAFTATESVIGAGDEATINYYI